MILFTISLDTLLISVKSGTTSAISYNYARIKIDSYEKILTLDIVIIFIKLK